MKKCSFLHVNTLYGIYVCHKIMAQRLTVNLISTYTIQLTVVDYIILNVSLEDALRLGLGRSERGFAIFSGTFDAGKLDLPDECKHNG